jgi:hypothetical protein
MLLGHPPRHAKLSAGQPFLTQRVDRLFGLSETGAVHLCGRCRLRG